VNAPAVWPYSSASTSPGAISPGLRATNAPLRPDSEWIKPATTDNSGTYATGNRIQSFAGLAFLHDSDGNVIRKISGTDTTRYYWSAEGRLDSVRLGSNTARYDYDVGGRLVRRRRTGQATHYLLWHGDQLLAELDSTGTQRIEEYAYYPGIDAPLAIITGNGTTTIRYISQDRLGNVTGVVTGNSIAQSVLYDAWGRQTVSGTLGDTNRLRWKGLIWDGDVTQLYFMRNRWYDPQTGRFVSEDPVGLGGGLNVYAFAGGNPIGGLDPFGLDNDGCKTLPSDPPKHDPSNPQYPPWHTKEAGKATDSDEYCNQDKDADPSLGGLDPLLGPQGYVQRHGGGSQQPRPRQPAPRAPRQGARSHFPGLVPFGRCIDRYTSTPLGLGLVANVTLSWLVGSKPIVLGASTGYTSWTRLVGSVLDAARGTGQAFEAFGRAVGRASLYLTGLIGGYDYGIIAQCAAGTIR
jgi:RHS repeat-associated protein